LRLEGTIVILFKKVNNPLRSIHHKCIALFFVGGGKKGDHLKEKERNNLSGSCGQLNLRGRLRAKCHLGWWRVPEQKT